MALADKMAVAACGFGAALVGGCPPEIYQKGRQLAWDILLGARPRSHKRSGAFLRGADLSGASMSGAKLGEADLSGARVADEQLAQTASLKCATLPDGTLCE